MGAVAAVLMGLGGLVVLVGAIMMLVAAFKESLMWGLGCLILPFVSLVFLVMHWQVAKKPFLIQLAGLAVMAVGGGLGVAFGQPMAMPTE
jgi:hypothetical protein